MILQPIMTNIYIYIYIFPAVVFVSRKSKESAHAVTSVQIFSFVPPVLTTDAGLLRRLHGVCKMLKLREQRRKKERDSSILSGVLPACLPACFLWCP